VPVRKLKCKSRMDHSHLMLYMSHQYMAIDRGRFRRRRGVCAPPPKNPFWVVFFAQKSLLTSYPGFAPDRYKLFVVFSIFTLYGISGFFHYCCWYIKWLRWKPSVVIFSLCVLCYFSSIYIHGETNNGVCKLSMGPDKPEKDWQPWKSTEKSSKIRFQ
jgi:hypothetical protein